MFEQCLYFNTAALARIVEKIWNAAFIPFDLTPSQAFMLRLILKNPGLAQRSVASQLGIAKATATRILLGLEKKRLIERKLTDDDHRFSLVYATQKAKKISQALDQASGRVTKKIIKIIGKPEFIDTVTQIRQIRHSLDT